MNQTALELGVVKREAISTQIAVRLRKDIFTGVYLPGDRLPPEREIAERFGISRVTVRQALQELAREEWIEIVQGRGATVLDFSRKVGLDVLPSLLASSPLSVVNPETFKTMHDFSFWLYRQICVSASLHANASHEKQLLEIIHSYKVGITARDYFRIDESFYYALLDIGKNLVLRTFFNTYMKTFQLLVETGIFQAPPLPRALYIQMNADLIKAVCGNRPDRIAAILEKYHAEIQVALNKHLKILGIDVFGTAPNK